MISAFSPTDNKQDAQEKLSRVAEEAEKKILAYISTQTKRRS
jgi:hypothetical protein